MRHASLALALLPLLATPVAAGTVELSNLSTRTPCAEHDNVDLRLGGAGVSGFRIEATQPAYGAEIMRDSTAPDWRGCPPHTQDGSKDFTFEPRELVLHEDARILVKGFTFFRFWRAEQSQVRVGDREERGLHLLQIWWKTEKGPEEVVVLYPTDGYWRFRPVPLPQLEDAVYGTSLLLGPIEDHEGRPIVDLASVAFDPASLRFDLAFRRGGTASLTLGAVDRERVAATVTLGQPSEAGRPFANLRSMYVNRWRNDAALIGWREAEGGPWRAEPVLGHDSAVATELRLYRDEISMHNTSAPDLRLWDFR